MNGSAHFKEILYTGVLSITNANMLSDFDQRVENAIYGDISAKNGFNFYCSPSMLMSKMAESNRLLVLLKNVFLVNVGTSRDICYY